MFQMLDEVRNDAKENSLKGFSFKNIIFMAERCSRSNSIAPRSEIANIPPEAIRSIAVQSHNINSIQITGRTHSIGYMVDCCFLVHQK